MQADPSFAADSAGLAHALELLSSVEPGAGGSLLPDALPEHGLGETRALDDLAPHVLGAAARLDGPTAFAHMDPPTPWLTWALSAWSARLNQNLLHPATAPFAREAEARVVAWLAPFFGMDGGHMTPGSTVANLTALWAARDAGGAKRVVASSVAHLSVRKAARILGLGYEEVVVDAGQRLDPAAVPGDLSDACLVLTAGSTSAGAIDPLALCGRAAWTHVDAAWAGPLRLSERHAGRLDGVEKADSVAVSAHKWLFQPKEAALVLFRDAARANAAISFGGAYLAAPNVGILGSHGAVAVPLLGTLLAWGRSGLAERLDRCMEMSERLAGWIETHPELELFGVPETGVVLFRPRGLDPGKVLSLLPRSLASVARIGGEPWLRCVAANPNADVESIMRHIEQAVSALVNAPEIER